MGDQPIAFVLLFVVYRDEIRNCARISMICRILVIGLDPRLRSVLIENGEF